MNILVTGGCGYKGTVLVPKLLARGHKVRVLDTIWFGNFLAPRANLSVAQGDVRDIDQISLDGFDSVIHLSSVANDPCGDLDPKLTWEISALATMQFADKAVRAGIERFIYASSGSVYGIKEEFQVTEDLELKPISEYKKRKWPQSAWYSATPTKWRFRSSGLRPYAAIRVACGWTCPSTCLRCRRCAIRKSRSSAVGRFVRISI